MRVIVRIPDDLAQRLGGAVEQLERRALEALALEEFRLGHLTRPEPRRLLGFRTRSALHEFLAAHEVFGTYTQEDLERTGKTCSALVSEGACGSSSPIPDRLITWC